MSQDKAASKRKHRKAVPVLGAAGLSLTLASGASAAYDRSTADMTARHPPVTQEITLAEEEISGVSLATFHGCYVQPRPVKPRKYTSPSKRAPGQ